MANLYNVSIETEIEVDDDIGASDAHLIEETTEIVSYVVAGMALLGMVSDCLAYLIGSRLRGGKSSSSLMKMQAFVDVLQCVYLLNTTMSRNGIIPRLSRLSNFWCKAVASFYTFAPQAVALATSCIALDRVVAVVAPFFYNEHANQSVGFVVSLFSLVIAACVTAPSMILTNLDVEKDSCSRASEYDFVPTIQSYFAMMNVPITALSTLVVAIKITRKSPNTGQAVKKSSPDEHEGAQKNSQHMSKREAKVTLGLGVLCIVFVITTIGYNTMQIIAKSTKPTDHEMKLRRTLYFSFSNTFLAINSISTAPIYLCIKPMRRALFRKNAPTTATNAG